MLRGLLIALLCCLPLAAAGPVDFGMAELNSALEARKLRWKIKPEVSTDPPETYRIDPLKAGGVRISGGDLRGLMYALLEAADQIRTYGRMKQVHGVPATAVRGIRLTVPDEAGEKSWYDSEDFWRGYFRMMARNRFNRINLVYAHRAADLAPPYTMLRLISQMATDFGIDFTLGIPDLGALPGSRQSVHTALGQLLAACPMVRGIQIAPDTDVSTSSDGPVEFYRDNVLRVVHEAGRRVTLELRDGPLQPDLLKTAEELGLALRIASLHAPEDRDRSDPGPEMPKSYIAYRELPGESGPLEDYDSIASAISDLTSGGAAGFEIGLPPADPDFGREDLSYWLWGRLGYDPKSHDPKSPDPKSSGSKGHDPQAAPKAARPLP